MIDRVHYPAGEGELSYGRVLRQALGMLRDGYGRVALVALILFVPPPLLVAALDGWRDGLEADPGLIRGLGYLVGILVITLIRLLGPVVYAGYLDEAVGHEYFEGERIRFMEVLRSLPWVRLVVADLILVVGAVVGLALFVLPGLIWYTLFGLVGPVIVQEKRAVVDAFRRTYELSRQAWRMVFLLVVLVVAGEHLIAELAHEASHDYGLGVQLVVEWVIAATIGGAIGLIEVALATELMARRPERRRKPV